MNQRFAKAKPAVYRCKDLDPVVVGKNVKACRTHLGYTQLQLATQVGLRSRSHLVSIEKGYVLPSLSLLAEMAFCLGRISLDALCYGRLWEHFGEAA